MKPNRPENQSEYRISFLINSTAILMHFRLLFYRSDSTSSTAKNINLGKAAIIQTKVSKNNSFSFFPTPITELKKKTDFIGRTKKKKIHIHSEKRETVVIV